MVRTSLAIASAVLAMSAAEPPRSLLPRSASLEQDDVSWLHEPSEAALHAGRHHDALSLFTHSTLTTWRGFPHHGPPACGSPYHGCTSTPRSSSPRPWQAPRQLQPTEDGGAHEREHRADTHRGRLGLGSGIGLELGLGLGFGLALGVGLE